MNLLETLEKLAERHGLSTEPETIRGRQIAAWAREFGPLSTSQVAAVASVLDRLDSWPRYGEIADAVRRAKRVQAVPGAARCPACRDSGWLGIDRGDGRPWAGACHCTAGQMLSGARPRSAGMVSDPVVVELVPRDEYHRRLAEAAEP